MSCIKEKRKKKIPRTIAHQVTHDAHIKYEYIYPMVLIASDNFLLFYLVKIHNPTITTMSLELESKQSHHQAARHLGRVLFSIGIILAVLLLWSLYLRYLCMVEDRAERSKFENEHGQDRCSDERENWKWIVSTVITSLSSNVCSSLWQFAILTGVGSIVTSVLPPYWDVGTIGVEWCLYSIGFAVLLSVLEELNYSLH